MKPRSLWVASLALLVLALGTPVYSATYSTSFPLTENPISESGLWINGDSSGLDWANVRTTPGLAFGTQTSAGYDDSTALLTGAWGPDQTVEATVRVVSPAPSGALREVELRLRSTITAHANSGYEVLCPTHTNVGYGIQIVRWFGPLGSYNYIATGPSTNCVNGDVLKASIVGNPPTITVWRNGVQVVRGTDPYANPPTMGNPGIGFWHNWGPEINATHGWSSFTATDAGSDPPPPPPPPPSNTLSVTKAGAGIGTVTSSPAGISCGATCSVALASGTVVTLTAVPSAGSSFTGWSGAGCSGTGTCVVTLTSALSVGATFAAVPPPVGQVFRLTVTKSGIGTVTSSPSGISCGATCTATFPIGTTVNLAPSRSGLTFGVRTEIVR